MKKDIHRKPNQCAILLKHLQEYGSITQRQAIIEYGIGQPAARIWELRKQGKNITTTMTDGVNRYGQTCRYAVYSLTRDDREEREKL